MKFLKPESCEQIMSIWLEYLKPTTLRKQMIIEKRTIKKLITRERLIYIYIYIYIEREREGGREGGARG